MSSCKLHPGEGGTNVQSYHVSYTLKLLLILQAKQFLVEEQFENIERAVTGVSIFYTVYTSLYCKGFHSGYLITCELYDVQSFLLQIILCYYDGEHEDCNYCGDSDLSVKKLCNTAEKMTEIQFLR
jgi:hypothetical protein